LGQLEPEWEIQEPLVLPEQEVLLAELEIQVQLVQQVQLEYKDSLVRLALLGQLEFKGFLVQQVQLVPLALLAGKVIPVQLVLLVQQVYRGLPDQLEPKELLAQQGHLARLDQPVLPVRLLLILLHLT
jgi:hypothetical protein